MRWRIVQIDELDEQKCTQKIGANPCQFSGSGQVTLSNFPEILLKLSLPHVMNICKIWMKSVKKWYDCKAF